MRNIGSKLFVLLVLAAIAAGLAYAFMPQPIEVDLVEVQRGDLQVTVDEDGKTRIREKYVVSAPLNGRILRISLDPGDTVVAGKTLLTMIEPRDPELLDARSVAQAEARVQAADAAVRQSATQFEKARHAQSLAERNVTRDRQAARTNAISQAELDTSEFEFRQASEEFRAARIAEEIARFELEQAKAALIRSRPRDEAAENSTQQLVTTVSNGNSSNGNSSNGNSNSESHEAHEAANGNGGWNFPIYSPINGRVLRVLQESAAVVTPGTPLVELGDPDDLEVEIDVLSRDAVKIHPNDLVYLEHWGGDRPLEGRVRNVEPSGFTKISTLGVEEQRVYVIVDLVEPPEKRTTLGDGFRVEARVVIDEVRGALKVPTSALFRVSDGPAVFQVVEGVVRQQKVKTGRQNGLEAEILEGLKEGDHVVLHPSDQVEEGVEVRQR
jgi:HlyD family secretion protein